MGKRYELSRKKYFYLCWEYLKRSDDYREFCEWRKTIELPIPPLNNLTKLTLPKKFESRIPGKIHPFFEIYPFWGGLIFSGDFHSWWRNFEEGHRLIEPVVPFAETVEDFFEGIILTTKEYAEQVVERFRECSRSCFPTPLDTLKEIIGEYSHIVTDQLKEFIDFRPRIVLDIRIDRSISPEKLEKELIKIFKRTIKNKLKSRKWINGIWFYPTGPLRSQQLQKYLDVYDRRKEGKTWRQVGAEVYPYLKFDSELRTILSKQNRKAERIIRNVEKGIFPGKY